MPSVGAGSVIKDFSGVKVKNMKFHASCVKAKSESIFSLSCRSVSLKNYSILNFTVTTQILAGSLANYYRQ